MPPYLHDKPQTLWRSHGNAFWRKNGNTTLWLLKITFITISKTNNLNSFLGYNKILTVYLYREIISFLFLVLLLIPYVIINLKLLKLVN